MSVCPFWYTSKVVVSLWLSDDFGKGLDLSSLVLVDLTNYLGRKLASGYEVYCISV